MLLNASRIEVWAAGIPDQPGGVAQKLEALAAAGANLEFIIARRNHSKPGTGVVFVTPIQGAGQVQKAREVGFANSTTVSSVRVEGPDQPGFGYQVTHGLASAGINLRGLSAGRIGKMCVMYLAFDSPADADAAARIINTL